MPGINNIDTILTSRLQKKDADAFAILFKKYYVQLCRYAFIFLKESNASEEVVMNLFTDIWDNVDYLDHVKSLKSYLYRSVRNRCLNWIRDNHKTEEITESISSLLYYDNSPTELKELNILIEEAISSLPDRCRTVFISSRYNDMTNKEIANYLNISAKTVEAQITKALKIIRNHIYISNNDKEQ